MWVVNKRSNLFPANTYFWVDYFENYDYYYSCFHTKAKWNKNGIILGFLTLTLFSPYLLTLQKAVFFWKLWRPRKLVWSLPHAPLGAISSLKEKEGGKFLFSSNRTKAMFLSPTQTMVSFSTEFFLQPNRNVILKTLRVLKNWIVRHDTEIIFPKLMKKN